MITLPIPFECWHCRTVTVHDVEMHPPPSLGMRGRGVQIRMIRKCSQCERDIQLTRSVVGMIADHGTHAQREDFQIAGWRCRRKEKA